jgi:hypothetical protein
MTQTEEMSCKELEAVKITSARRAFASSNARICRDARTETGTLGLRKFLGEWRDRGRSCEGKRHERGD